jgi:hypothetical protein
MQPTNGVYHIDLDTRVKRSETQMSADLGGEMAILNLKTGTYLGLNEVGARIWNFLSEDRTVREIRELIMQEYAVDSLRCEQDITKLLSELARYELVALVHVPDQKI